MATNFSMILKNASLTLMENYNIAFTYLKIFANLYQTILHVQLILNASLWLAMKVSAYPQTKIWINQEECCGQTKKIVYLALSINIIGINQEVVMLIHGLLVLTLLIIFRDVSIISNILAIYYISASQQTKMQLKLIINLLWLAILIL